MTIQQIPLAEGQPQTFSVKLGGIIYTMTLQYRDADEGGWVLDIGDVNNVPILRGIPLVTGADLLAQYDYLEFGGKLYVQSQSDPDSVPTFESLGSDGLLYWVSP